MIASYIFHRFFPQSLSFSNVYRAGLRVTAMAFSNRSDACKTCPVSAAVRRHETRAPLAPPEENSSALAV